MSKVSKINSVQYSKYNSYSRCSSKVITVSTVSTDSIRKKITKLLQVQQCCHMGAASEVGLSCCNNIRYTVATMYLV